MVNFDNGLIIKAIVFVVIMAFMLQLFSFGGGSYDRQEPEPTPTPQQDLGPQMLGSSKPINATIVDYPDNIIVMTGNGVGEDTALNERVSELITEGKVSYTNSVDPRVLNIVLTPGTSTKEVGWELSADYPGYTTYAKADFSLPQSVVFTTAGGQKNVSTYTRYTATTEPLIEEGGNITVVLSAIIQGNEIVGSFKMELADVEEEAEKQFTVASCPNSYQAELSYDWENRKINETQVLESIQNKFSANATIEYEEESFILLYNVTEEGAGALSNHSYVLSVADNIVLVNESLTDREMIEQDFAGVLGENASIEFSESTAVITITSNQSISAEELAQETGADSASIAKECALEISSPVRLGGREYLLSAEMPLLTELLDPSIKEGEEVNKTVVFTLNGARVVKITPAE